MTKRQMRVVYINLFLLIILSPFYIFAEWIGPKEIIAGTWGKEIGQFYYEPQDTADSFPKEFVIDKDGNIIIRDEGNFRILIYNQMGRLKNVIKKPPELPELDAQYYWPWGIKLLSNNWIAIDCDAQKDLQGKYTIKKCFLDYNGKIVNKIEWAEMFLVKDGFIFKKGETYPYYSNSGQLLKTYDTRPLELGITQQKSLGDGHYETSIEYPDKKWKVKGLCTNYPRDACGILYCVDNAVVIRYDDEGKDVAFIGMPDEKVQEIKIPDPPPGVDMSGNVLEQYGSPVLAPNGDVYTWKRTPDKYSIIKWVWVDGPECPQYLDVTPTKNSLKFTWQKPTKDADKVTGYQLLQSYNICGPFKQTALLKKDQLSYEDRDVKKGETYYYIVKAVRGKEYSGNSNKVCGQIE